MGLLAGMVMAAVKVMACPGAKVWLIKLKDTGQFVREVVYVSAAVSV